MIAVRQPALSLLFVLTFACGVFAGETPSPMLGQWRGNATGLFPEPVGVTVWSDTTNVVWKAETGSAFSSPISVDGKVFVTAEPNLLVCLNAADGKELWRKTNGPADLPAEKRSPNIDEKSEAGNAAPSPVSDGKTVFAYFHSGIAAAYGMDGTRKWITHFDCPIGSTDHGRSASPLLVGGLLLLHFDRLIAVDPATGAMKWEAQDASGAYGTPVAAKIGDEDVAITPAGAIVRVRDGKVVANDIARCNCSSPVVVGRIVYFIDSSATALELPEKCEDKIKPKELWFGSVEGEVIASPVIHEGLIYTVTSDAKYFILDAAKGEVVAEKKPLELPPAGNAPEPGAAGAFVYASVTLAGKAVYLSNTAGNTFVLQTGKEYKEIARNNLPDGSGGSMLPLGDKLLIRGGPTLYCIGKK